MTSGRPTKFPFAGVIEALLRTARALSGVPKSRQSKLLEFSARQPRGGSATAQASGGQSLFPMSPARRFR